MKRKKEMLKLLMDSECRFLCVRWKNKEEIQNVRANACCLLSLSLRRSCGQSNIAADRQRIGTEIWTQTNLLKSTRYFFFFMRFTFFFFFFNVICPSPLFIAANMVSNRSLSDSRAYELQMKTEKNSATEGRYKWINFVGERAKKAAFTSEQN